MSPDGSRLWLVSSGVVSSLGDWWAGSAWVKSSSLVFSAMNPRRPTWVDEGAEFFDVFVEVVGVVVEEGQEEFFASFLNAV